MKNVSTSRSLCNVSDIKLLEESLMISRKGSFHKAFDCDGLQYLFNCTNNF